MALQKITAESESNIFKNKENPIAEIVTDTVTVTVTDTITDTAPMPDIETVTDTITDTVEMPDIPTVTDAITDTAKMEEAEILAGKIYENLTNKNSLGITSASDEIFRNITEKITPENVNQLLLAYKKDNNESLITHLMESASLTREERVELTKHVTDCLLECAKNNGAYVEDLSGEFINAYNEEKNAVIGFFNAEEIEHIEVKLNKRLTKSKMQERSCSERLYSVISVRIV